MRRRSATNDCATRCGRCRRGDHDGRARVATWARRRCHRTASPPAGDDNDADRFADPARPHLVVDERRAVSATTTTTRSRVPSARRSSCHAATPSIPASAASTAGSESQRPRQHVVTHGVAKGGSTPDTVAEASSAPVRSHESSGPVRTTSSCGPGPSAASSSRSRNAGCRDVAVDTLEPVGTLSERGAGERVEQQLPDVAVELVPELAEGTRRRDLAAHEDAPQAEVFRLQAELDEDPGEEIERATRRGDQRRRPQRPQRAESRGCGHAARPRTRSRRASRPPV